MSRETVGRPMEILMVEDSLLFARLAIAALKKGGVQHRLTWLTDGSDAWNFLQKSGAYVNAPHPDLLLLDLMLPGMDGKQLLANIRSNESLKNLPVIVMTANDDSESAHSLPVEAYLTKPLVIDHFLETVHQLSRFWRADMIVPAHVNNPSELSHPLEEQLD